MSDEQLLSAINSMQLNLKTEITAIKNDMSAMKDALLEHIHAVGAQLHIQIQEADARHTERMERIEASMHRQGGLIQSGSRAITRFIEWTESADTTFTRYDRRLAEIEKRLDRVEKK